jgi:hypothetical protein
VVSDILVSLGADGHFVDANEMIPDAVSTLEWRLMIR